ncbi:MAG: histidinol-phosphate aminotransferase [Solirubrobacteraceae bacterium]|jgi:protein-tyrosine phosphatase|nr:histidinol-phosphate aminotransferase [Solirubrobacteraceae bacterium]
MSEWFERFGFGAVGDGLLTGAYPLDAADVAELAAAGVDEVYNLCEDVEYDEGNRAAVEAALDAAGITERRLSLVDYGGLPAPALERATREVCAGLAAGHRVYLHCRAGWQRSAAVAAGVIALREGTSIGSALDRLRERRPAAEPLAHQATDLLAWWAGRDG